MHKFEEILESMLNFIPDNIDKREGSVTYNSIAPAAYELAKFYAYLEDTIDYRFIDTATEENLDKCARDFNEFRKPATKSIRKITTNITVPISSRWAIEDVIFNVTKEISANSYEAECEQYGIVGNLYSGAMVSIENLQAAAVLEDVLIYGEELESDESLRKRLKDKISNSSKDGNIAQYQQWASEYSGIGKAKIFPLWNGGNTVKISITSASNTPASESLIEAFQQYMDPNSSGLGEGKAPLGAKVTVTTGTPKVINIAAEIVLEEGYSDAAEASAKIVEYFRTITYRQSYVSYFYVGNILVGLDSIYDIRNLTLNGLTADIALGAEEIPTLGSLNLTVVS